jgi:hypothetical protein
MRTNGKFRTLIPGSPKLPPKLPLPVLRVLSLDGNVEER